MSTNQSDKTTYTLDTVIDREKANTFIDSALKQKYYWQSSFHPRRIQIVYTAYVVHMLLCDDIDTTEQHELSKNAVIVLNRVLSVSPDNALDTSSYLPYIDPSEVVAAAYYAYVKLFCVPASYRSVAHALCTRLLGAAFDMTTPYDLCKFVTTQERDKYINN